MDVAYNASTYPLLVRGADGGYRLLGLIPYTPFGYDDPGAWTRFRRRLQFQLSMGAPF